MSAQQIKDALVVALKETLEEAIGWFDYSTGKDPEKLDWVIRARAALKLAVVRA